MKTWIKRTLIGLAASGLLLGGLAAWAHRKAEQHMGWRTMSEGDAAQMKAQVVERIGAKLELDATQKAKLGVLADKLREGRNAMVAGTPDPRAEMQGLIAGNTFDRTRATQLLQAQVAAVNTQSPALITAMGDFYDSLNAQQQAQVREFMAKRGRHRDRDRD